MHIVCVTTAVQYMYVPTTNHDISSTAVMLRQFDQ